MKHFAHGSPSPWNKSTFVCVWSSFAHSCPESIWLLLFAILSQTFSLRFAQCLVFFVDLLSLRQSACEYPSSTCLQVVPRPRPPATQVFVLLTVCSTCSLLATGSFWNVLNQPVFFSDHMCGFCAGTAFATVKVDSVCLELLRTYCNHSRIDDPEVE